MQRYGIYQKLTKCLFADVFLSSFLTCISFNCFDTLVFTFFDSLLTFVKELSYVFVTLLLEVE